MTTSGTQGTTRSGSAACATAVAAARLRRANRKVTITPPSGANLLLDWRESDDHVLMTGPTELEYEGRFDPSVFANVA